ncbi:hypothetical protein F5890DRAFT_1550968 [Lentinula detonsa]|uniref:DUF6534 domain-containing protein n=1 Tax=Lentinula detonsa TaxID=2804962 RepID=A0AA38Q609_9AGAR|nr:hypothetical protein F5890DRAFT_1550968 [Lentinula detonsa]
MARYPAEIAQGPMFIGYSFNIVLYGIMITQVYLYFNTFKQDRLWMKILVAGLLLADTVNAIFDAVYLYDSLVIHFGISTRILRHAAGGQSLHVADNIAYLGNATWVFATDPAMTALIAGTVQLFFAWRVKILTTNWWIVSIVVLASLTGLVGGLVTAYEVGVTPHFVDFRNFKWSVIMWLAGECFADLGITSVLVWHLPRRKHKTGFQASDELIDRIIRLAVQTGLITAFCATLDLIFFLTDPTGTHLIFNFPLAKLYTNSVMSSLNSRGAWNYSTPHSKLGNSLPTTIITTGDGNGDTFRPSSAPPISPSRVYVHVESHELRDFDVEANYPNRPKRVKQNWKPTLFVNTENTASEKESCEESEGNSSVTQIGPTSA